MSSRKIFIGVTVMLTFTTFAAFGLTPYRPAEKQKVNEQISIDAWAFDLTQVRLLDSIFKDAMERDARYLRRLEPDRFLAWFRKEAGLEPKGEVYGGWESQGIAGHCGGHYLSACSMLYAATGEKEFKKRVDYMVDELAVCQKANGSGYIGAIPDGEQIFDEEISKGEISSGGFDLNGLWVPWYTHHKVMTGLRDAYLYCNNQKALDVLTGFADWAYEITAGLNEHQWQEMLDCEHGGMNEIFADIYALTGDKKYLELAEKFYHKAILDPLARKESPLPGLHANTQVPKVIGTARLYELTAKEKYKTISRFFWKRMLEHHTYVNGGNSSYEHLGEPDKLSDRLGDTTETCNTYNMLKLTRHLFTWSPQAKESDYYENALYNHILASQHPETGMMKYKGYLEMPARKEFCTPFNSFWCCVGTGMENHVKYNESIYYHKDDTLYVNLFIPSELDWESKGVKVTQKTDYPAGQTSTLAFECQKASNLTVKIRHPFWCDNPVVKINGEVQKTDSQPQSYITVSEKWENGDKLEITLPMKLRIRSMPDNKNRIAFLYGPVLLAADLNKDKPLPYLVAENYKEVVDSIKPVEGKSLRFTLKNTGRVLEGSGQKSVDVNLRPLYTIGDEKYTVYMDLVSRNKWNEKLDEYKAELRRQRRLAERTLDNFRIGEMQPEREHNLSGENTTAGEWSGRKWRHATDGGHFEFDMKVSPNEPVALQVTYWGSDGGGRSFDILVEDKKIADQTLDAEKPGQFFNVTYSIPEKLTKGKQKIRVRFQAHPGRTAGGVFGVRTVKRDKSGKVSGNPVFPGADPDSLLVDDTVWVYPTYRRGSERKFFVYSSKDLVNWKFHSEPILNFENIDWIPEDKEAWAPGIAEKDGKYYLYYSCGPKPSYIGVAVSNSPAGPFKDSGKPLLADHGDPDYETIDAMVFTDPDTGDSYLYAGGSAGSKLLVYELNEDMVSLKRKIDAETPPNFTEGPFVHYRDGTYYLSYSHGIWWDGSYTVHYATSDSPTGPWNYQGKIMSSNQKHRGPGHHSILYNPGMDEWYIFYHRWNNKTEKGPYDDYRRVAIEKLEYDEDGLIKPIPMTDKGAGPVKLGEKNSK